MATLTSRISLSWLDLPSEERELLPKEIRTLLDTTPTRSQISAGTADTTGVNFSVPTGFGGNYKALVVNTDPSATLKVLTNIPTTAANSTIDLVPGDWIRIPVNNGVGLFLHTASGKCKYAAVITGPAL